MKMTADLGAIRLFPSSTLVTSDRPLLRARPEGWVQMDDLKDNARFSRD